ncbi:MAG: RNA pyrophosphohydrolase [Alphaproteobacteria bacterium]|nr:RNA pyrophosphohydrolase [Alphaproteobacteria bacterium]
MQQHETTSMPSGLPYRKSVGLCLFNHDGLVFCAQRRQQRGAWQMPQGGIRKDEDPAVALMREMKEEIGTDKGRILMRHPAPLRYEFPDYLQFEKGVFNGKYRGQEQIWFAVLFEGTDADINLTSSYEEELPEFNAWRWVELAQTLSLIVNFKRPVYEEVIKTFAPLVDKIRAGDI